jgi:FKBP-type peptidyl-prolyl cis-trans isomerase
MDRVHIKLQCRVYHQGKVIKKLAQTKMNFMVGLSGESVHVQVLGAKNILAKDDNGTSDPYMLALFQGKKLGITRIKPRTVNPRWKNETFIVPMADNLPDSRGMIRSARGLFKLEAYDYDWVGANDFLGHFEIHKDKLKRIADASNAQPLIFPLTTKEFHGIIGLRMGLSTTQHVVLKVVRAESLDKFNPFNDGRPFVKIWFGDEYLGATSWEYDNGEVTWDGPLSVSEFRLRINTVLRRERTLLKKREKLEEQIKAKADRLAAAKKAKRNSLREARALAAAGVSPSQYEDDVAAGVEKQIEDQPLDLTEDLVDHEHIDTVFRLEIYEYNYVRAPSFLGSLAVPVDDLRLMCQQLPVHLVDEKVEPGSEQEKANKGLQAQRIKLNRTGVCGSATVDLNDDVDEEEDDEWWVKRFGELEDQSQLSSVNDDPLMDRLAEVADKKASSGNLDEEEDAVQSEFGDEKSNTTPEGASGDSGEVETTGLGPGVALVAKSEFSSPQSKTDSVMEVLKRSKDAERSELTAKNLEDPARKVRSPSTLPSPVEAQADGEADAAGTDGELDRDDRSEEVLEKWQSKGDSGVMPGSGWVPALRKKHRTVFTVSTISDGLDNMTGAIEQAEDGQEDARTAYLRIAAESEADMKSLGGTTYIDEEQRREEGREETGFDDEGDDPRSMLLAPKEPSAAPAPCSEQHLIEHLKDVGEEEAAMESQRQKEQEVTTARSRLSHSSDGKKSTTDDAELGVRKRDRISKRAMPPKQEQEAQNSPSQAEEGKEGDSLESTYQDLSESQEDLNAMASLSKMNKTSEGDTIVFGKIRHYQVHRKSEKMEVDESGKEPDLGHVILRLLPSARGNVIAGLDEGVRHMSLGETANIKVRFDHAYNSFGMTDYIPARANMVFTVRLQAINGFGLAGLPLRISKRIYRFTTVFCRKTSDLVRFIVRDAKKKKRIRRVCSWLYSFIKKAELEVEEEEEEEVEFFEENATSSDDEEEQAVVIRADRRMKSHLTPSVHAGAKYFWGYTPKVKAKKKKRKKDEEKEDSEDDDSEEEELFDGLEDIEEGEWEEQEAESPPGGSSIHDEGEVGGLEGEGDVELNPVEPHLEQFEAQASAHRSETGSVNSGDAPPGSAYSRETLRSKPARSGARPPPPK